MKFGGAGHDGPGTGFSLRSTGGLSGVRSTDERFEVAKILYMPDCVPAYGGNFRNPQDRIASPDGRIVRKTVRGNRAARYRRFGGGCGPYGEGRTGSFLRMPFPYRFPLFGAGSKRVFRDASKSGACERIRVAKARLFDPRKAGRASAEDDAGGGGCRFRALSFRRRRGRGLRSC